MFHHHFFYFENNIVFIKYNLLIFQVWFLFYTYWWNFMSNITITMESHKSYNFNMLMFSWKFFRWLLLYQILGDPAMLTSIWFLTLAGKSLMIKYVLLRGEDVIGNLKNQLRAIISVHYYYKSKLIWICEKSESEFPKVHL